MVKTGYTPHIIISSVEHKSILSCCEDLKNDGLCQYTKVNVQTSGPNYGMVDPEDLESAIKPNTCLISIMTANNETGIINDIPALVAVAHRHRIPFHTDCVQSFGKIGVYNGVDACSISFHKLHGPPGLGCLIIRNNFIEGYGLKALIAGSQNSGLRGGTENIPAIGASYAAYKYTYLKRLEKNNYLRMMINYLKSLLCKYLTCHYIDEYEYEKGIKNKLFWIANRDDDKVLCNTLLLAVYKDNFCNIKMREVLSDHGIIISIGSACNAANNKSSDVVQSLNIPKELRSGILRISLPDDVKKQDIIKFVSHFLGLIDMVHYE
jgi:cysteine desulfurase